MKRIDWLIRDDSEWTYQAKEKALELLKFYSKDTTYDWWLEVGWVIALSGLILSVVLIVAVGQRDDLKSLAIGGVGCMALGVVGGQQH
jgi:hypothetical protein